MVSCILSPHEDFRPEGPLVRQRNELDTIYLDERHLLRAWPVVATSQPVERHAEGIGKAHCVGQRWEPLPALEVRDCRWLQPGRFGEVGLRPSEVFSRFDKTPNKTLLDNRARSVVGGYW